MRTLRSLTVLLLLAAGREALADVVVLRGGKVIELKSPLVRRGNTALLTRADGALLSIPVSEIDAAATAAAQAVPAASPQATALAPAPSTPAEAARASRERPKARVRLTDADVGHEYVGPASEEKKETLAGGGAGRLEIGDYSQEKAGSSLVVAGTLRNAGGTVATLSRMTVTALNDKGETIASAEASVGNGTIAPSQSAAFTASLPVGEKTVVSLRFAPRWVAAPLPAPAGTAAGAAPSPSAGSAQGTGASPATAGSPGSLPPPPGARPAAAPMPPGWGVTYAAPPPSASFSPPADGRSGYIPGATHPENQPKPPQ